jgi:ubiquinone/menaquinone biosynthesis C-methylase UbiE
LDVGCGFGDTAVLLGKDLGEASHVVGVDCAENFVIEGRKLAQEEGLTNVDFLVADVQLEDLKGPYDFAFGRFGTMFFNMPGAAMRNIRKHLVPGGRLDMIVWRKREDNPWLHEAEKVVRELVPVVAHEDTDQVHCGPGPFSMAGPDVVSSMLLAAGFERITFERHDADICIGRDLNDAIEFAMALGPAGEIIRLAGEAGARLRPQVIEALRGVLAGFDTGSGVFAPSSTWFVRASRAG